MATVQVGYDDFVAAGSFNAAKEKGLVSASARGDKWAACMAAGLKKLISSATLCFGVWVFHGS